MVLENIKLINYKNFEALDLDLDAKINCFIGNNGVGKTNILEAIYYLSFTKGYFNGIASHHIKHKHDFFVIEGKYSHQNKSEIYHCSLKKGHKKMIKFNGKIYEKITEHIGKIPLVIISPNDRDLISEGSETRRKFMDSVISQTDRDYLLNVIKYQKVLKQRNSLLKYFAANHTFDELNLSIYNEQLEEFGNEIYKKRKQFIEDFSPIFEKRYHQIANNNEQVSIGYKSHLNDANFSTVLKNSLAKDRLVQYTSAGLHKDDLRFVLNDYLIKKFGSQGQQKTFLIALKLAQYDFISSKNTKKPILLLDDIFDKLDDSRVSHLLQLVNDNSFGQIFITDTNKERTEKAIKETKQSYQLFDLTL